MEPRAVAIAEAMSDIRAIDAEHREAGPDGEISRAGVEAIRDRLVEMASNRELFSLDVYPPPAADEKAKGRLYRIAQDDDDRFALYANASGGGVATPAHNHTTWAVVVGFEGQELNRFYERCDDGVVEVGHHMVEAGTGVAMLPDDLHSIHIDGPSLNFHCYGLALERLDRREFYDPKSGEWRIFAATSDIEEARLGLAHC